MTFLDEYYWWLIAGGLASLAAVSIFADRRRTRRRTLENVGFMPWTGMSVFATLLTVFAVAFAIKSG